jgi:hypothetical protein
MNLNPKRAIDFLVEEVGVFEDKASTIRNIILASYTPSQRISVFRDLMNGNEAIVGEEIFTYARVEKYFIDPSLLESEMREKGYITEVRGERSFLRKLLTPKSETALTLRLLSYGRHNQNRRGLR